MKFKALWVLLLVLSLAGCNVFSNTTPTPLPTVVLEQNNSASQPQGGGEGVTASGVVVPAQQVQVASNQAGIVLSVEVAVGDPVSAGQVLVRLAGGEKLLAALEAASLERLTAQQALDQLYKDLPDDQTTALQALTTAREAVRDAERLLHSLNTPAEDLDIESAWASVVLAREKLDAAREDFEPYENKPQDNVTRAALLNVLAEVQSVYDDAVRRYNNLAGISSSQFDRSQAEAELSIAQKRLELAQLEYDQLQNGPDPDQVALAEQRIQNTEAQIEASQTALNELEIKAPSNGTVGALNVHSGEWVISGQAVLLLVDLENLRVETTDLSERDIPKISVGQTATVFIEALGAEVSGRVIQIAPLAETLGGDVVYKTTIELDSAPEGLRAGMSVEVQF